MYTIRISDRNCMCAFFLSIFDKPYCNCAIADLKADIFMFQVPQEWIHVCTSYNADNDHEVKTVFNGEVVIDQKLSILGSRQFTGNTSHDLKFGYKRGFRDSSFQIADFSIWATTLNVDEMVRRLEYDLLYIENMSLFVDLKILIYTVQIVLKGAGK